MRYIHIIIILTLISLLIYVYLHDIPWQSGVVEGMSAQQNKHRTAVVLLSRGIPNTIWLDFLNESTEYDNFVVMDSGDISGLGDKYSNVNFVWIPDEICLQNNYKNSDYVFKPIVATDRAYYYFGRVNKKYDHVWFIEDDVWFKSMDDLKRLDQKYATADLIVPGEADHKSLDKWPHWHQIQNRLPQPWSHWIICVCRISRKLLQKMDDLVKEQGSLIYKETMFHTLAKQNNMQTRIPVELENITWKDDVLNIPHKDGYFYHPIKNVDMHKKMRINQ